MPISAQLDHVAIAVPDRDVAAQRWVTQLGAGLVSEEEHATFAVRQLRYTGGGKLELLAPPLADQSPDNFVRRYLDRFGAGVHHVTLKVPDLTDALDEVARAGLDAVDVARVGDVWHEAFLRPSQIGGIIVQLAWAAESDEDWAARVGAVPTSPRPGAAELRGPLLGHPDLDAAAQLWSVLGAEVSRQAGRLLAQWPGSPLSVAVVEDASARPRGLRFAGAGSLPPDNAAGPAVLEESGLDGNREAAPT